MYSPGLGESTTHRPISSLFTVSPGFPPSIHYSSSTVPAPVPLSSLVPVRSRVRPSTLTLRGLTSLRRLLTLLQRHPEACAATRAPHPAAHTDAPCSSAWRRLRHRALKLVRPGLAPRAGSPHVCSCRLHDGWHPPPGPVCSTDFPPA